MPRFKTFAKIAVAVTALVLIAIGLFELNKAESGLSITTANVGSTPVTIFRNSDGKSAPVIVIAHGFAGSQQLMQPFAETFARNGYIAVTFDFLGHGRNPLPMRGDPTEGLAITSALLKELGDVADYARKLPISDGRLAVLGHSMASDIVIRYGMAQPNVDATIAVSVFSPVVTATSPRNLLVIVGAIEPSMLRDEGSRIVGLVAGTDVVERRTYGDFYKGGARRLVLARGVEHIGVLYSQDSMRESLAWVNAAFRLTTTGEIDRRGQWLAFVFAGIIALAWPLSRLLPLVSNVPMGGGSGWKPLLLAGFLPAIATPLALWKMPTDFLQILLGDYLALHFGLYGLLTAGLLFYMRRENPAPSVASQPSWNKLAIAAAAVAAYEIIAVGLPLDRYVFSFAPIPMRIPFILAILCGTLPYFLADEWLTRGRTTSRGAYALTKFLFLMSLAIAVLLNPQKLFFLVIIVPAILLLFIAFGLISRWSYKRTNHPFPGAIANATLFAWAIAVTFPMVVR